MDVRGKQRTLKMRCRAPSCKNTSDDVSSESKGISFHAFPSEVGLHAAWLRALGKQDSLLLDSAVVCSQHFLDDDICATESGLRQLAPGAVPSTVQVCMICLNTDSRLFLMSKHKMEEAYEKLTGYPPCDVGNLKQALCIQCAQRLRTFSRFRDKSLRARAIMMDLVEKHEFITRQHIKMINRTKNQLDNSFVMTTLGPDPCDLHIQEHPSEEQQTDSEATLQTVEVKLEVGYDSMFDEDMTVANDDSIADYYVKDEFFAPDNSISEESKILDDALSQARERNQTVVDQVDQIQDLLKYKSALFQCFLCYEEFEAEPAYKLHMGTHGQAGAGGGERAASSARKARAAASSRCPDTALRTPHRRAVQKVQRGLRSTDLDQPAVDLSSMRLGTKVEAEEADTDQKSKQVFHTYQGEPDNRPFDTDGETYINLANRVVKTYAVKRPKKIVPLQNESLVIAQSAATISMDSNFQVASQDEDVKPVTNQMNVNNLNAYKTSKKKANCVNVDSSENSLLSERNWFTCERNLILPMRTRSEARLFFCKFCQYKSAYKPHLLRHMRTHTGQKPFLCELCDHRSADKSNLARHVKTHTGEKPYICKLCDYRCARASTLVYHMSLHTGAKRYSCKLCNCKYAGKSHLARHMRTHIGEKPFCCDLCDYRSAHKSYLARHVITHTGEKPYICKLCDYRCARKFSLVSHMKLHTREKCYSCKLCGCKYAAKSYLARHMRSHIGEKPFCCDLCDYRSAHKSYLARHVKTHTGEKPYICKLCDYRCARKFSLVSHMKSHTGGN